MPVYSLRKSRFNAATSNRHLVHRVSLERLQLSDGRQPLIRVRLLLVKRHELIVIALGFIRYDFERGLGCLLQCRPSNRFATACNLAPTSCRRPFCNCMGLAVDEEQRCLHCHIVEKVMAEFDNQVPTFGHHTHRQSS